MAGSLCAHYITTLHTTPQYTILLHPYTTKLCVFVTLNFLCVGFVLVVYNFTTCTQLLRRHLTSSETLLLTQMMTTGLLYSILFQQVYKIFIKQNVFSITFK